MPTYPIDNTIAEGDPAHPQHHIDLADAANDHQTRLTNVETQKADLASPTFTGTPSAPTATAGTNTVQLATTAFVTTAVASKANTASPTFTGTPAAPTATAGTNTTQLATTAFVTTAVSTKANLASPTFTGTPAAPTATAGTNTTQLATTAFVTSAVAAGGGGGGSFPVNGIGADHVSIFAPVGAYQPSFNFVASITTVSVPTGNRYALPFRPGGSFSADQFGVEVSTAGTAGSVMRMALYASDSAGRRPGSLITDYGTIATDTTGYKLYTISQAFTANTVYWLAWGSEVAAPTVRARPFTIKYPDTQARVFDGFSSAPTAFQMNGSGAYPSTWTDSGYATLATFPVMAFRRSA